MAAPNDLLMVGGARTVTEAVLLVVPVPVSLALTLPVVLGLAPAVAPVTVTLKLQFPPAAIEAPVRVIVFPPLVVRVPPPQVVEEPLTTVSPEGRESVKVTPVIPSEELVLVMIKVRDVVPPSEG